MLSYEDAQQSAYAYGGAAYGGYAQEPVQPPMEEAPKAAIVEVPTGPLAPREVRIAHMQNSLRESRR